ncbi:hypothetical protein CQW23_26420 [Capsicum baccatum]|uniref:Zinc finger GRF-type domain-containing protein n=1 Tax=Capsicum baccatum TaxID=33114 RepID=A0A2G2VNQ9_CAPBA|nr:hypothetical protein CQW23_26420 [Capsicum baccatum]
MCFMATDHDILSWHRKLGHATMPIIKKLSRLDLVKGLPKLKFEKDHICDAYQMGLVMEDVKLDLNSIFLDKEDLMLNAEVRCNHRLLLHLKTSWSDNNPKRRFWSCPYYGSNKCKFFLWRDGVVNERSKFIIPKLMKKVKDINEMLKIMKTKEELVGVYSDKKIMEMEAESAFTKIEEQCSSFVKMKDEVKNTP